jgi:peptidyl-prolyl cis-trans isomerase A (cyclophilin A)
MRTVVLALACVGGSIGVAHAQRANAASPSGLVHVVIQTSLGSIDVDVDTVHAPITAKNFLRYVDAHFYEGGQFHRTVRPDNQPNDSVKIGVIQARVSALLASSMYPPIPIETTKRTGLKHLDGTISMGRTSVSGAQGDFFICVGNQPALDFGGHRNADGQGFAAFGHVTHGMDVVRAIQAAHATGQPAQSLNPPITILHIRRAASGP